MKSLLFPLTIGPTLGSFKGFNDDLQMIFSINRFSY